MLSIEECIDNIKRIESKCKECGGDNEALDIETYYEHEEETDGRIYSHRVASVEYKCKSCNKKSHMVYI